MKQSLALLFICMFSVLTYGQSSKNMSQKQKLKDFDFLYRELAATYPYFGVNQRMHQVNWLDNKQKYRQLIESTSNDTAFIIAISQILGDLNNGHTDLLPTKMYDYFYKAYSRLIDRDKSYKPYVKELERYQAKNKVQHWQKIIEAYHAKSHTEESNTNTSLAKKVVSNVQTRFDEKRQTAIVSIRSFSYEHLEADQDILTAFFKKAHEYPSLIIDIQGNSGGDDAYWMSLIVGYLIDQSIDFPVVFGFKPSRRIQRLKPDYKANIKLQELDLPHLPKEFKRGDYQLHSTQSTIHPNEHGKAYKGTIHLLVDESVYSSSETLAYFCKATNFAKVYGQTTSGDGIGSDPLLLTLPHSGLIIRFTGEMALNPDGSANEETKTKPDVWLDGITTEARLQQLLEKIDKKEIK